MSELISGKEALIALANGSVVQGDIGFGWIDIDLNDDILLNSFITERNRNGIAVKFRLKPRTIEINGVEMNEPRLIHKVGPLLLSLEFGSESECNVFLKTLQNRNF